MDRFFISDGYFKTNKIEPFNETNTEEHRSCYTFREAANLSDHFQVAPEVKCDASLLKGTTRAFVTDLRVIQRITEEHDRHDKLSKADCDSDYGEEEEEQEDEDQTEVKQIMAW